MVLSLAKCGNCRKDLAEEKDFVKVMDIKNGEVVDINLYCNHQCLKTKIKREEE